MPKTVVCVYVVIISSLIYPCQTMTTGLKPRCEHKFTQDLRVELSFKGPASSVCGDGICCTPDQQVLYTEQAKTILTERLNKTLADLASILRNRAVKFDEFFKEMLNNSKRDFHDMFKKTYGVMYEQNSYVFTDLFQELEKYYANGRVDLTDAMDEFFTILYQKMFTVLNGGYNFSEKYLECVTEQMKELKPFGDVPSKLSTLLKRSFVATRSFSQALHVAANVVTNMQNVTLTSSCFLAFTKMSQCQYCHGHGGVLPCTNYCTNVMKGCLAYHALLHSQWNSFLDATDKVVDRLLGPFNIEMVVEPIDIKISEAIMNFQENAQQVSDRVFTKCGRPSLGRSKRENGEIEFETLDFSPRGNGRVDGGREGDRDGESGKLERVIKDTRDTLRSSTGFWYNLPYAIFKDLNDPLESCWNGTAVNKYLPAVVDDGFSNQVRNPEVLVDREQPNSLVNEQIFALRMTNNRLKSAYNGMDVEWIDNEEFEGSGSGSGDGIVSVETGSGQSPDITEVPVTSLYPMPYPSGRPDGNQESNEIPPIPNFGRSMNTTTSIQSQPTGSSSCLNRSAFIFIVPIILISFGNSIVGWLQ